jgi:hypothetical protein
MSAKNWHIRIEDSEITFIDKLLTGPAIEAKVETDVKNFLLSLGIEAKKIPEKAVRTPDYGNTQLGFEATTIHPYFPRMDEINKSIVDIQNNLGNCYYAYIYSDFNNKPLFKIVSKEKCDTSCSILCLRQHVSIYRNKIMNKIEDKSYQSENFSKFVLVLDFRTTHFDPVSLSKGICVILQEIGEQYSSLIGIIFAVSKNGIKSDIIQEPLFHFVSNPNSESISSALLNKLKNISRPYTSDLMQMLIPLIIYKSGMRLSITNPCINGPTMNQLQSMGLPVFPYGSIYD